MKQFKKHGLALVITGALAAFPVLAAEPDRTPEHVGLGTGAAFGALVGGPLGAIVGSVFGVMVGHDQVQKTEIEKHQVQLSQVQARLVQSRQQLDGTEQQLDSVKGSLMSEQRALTLAQQQLRELHQQRVALQELVSGLRLSVYFDHNSSDVSPQYQTLLESVGQGAGRVAGLVVDLDGHADKSGADPYNQQLSEQRSDRVGGLLVAKGLPEALLHKHAQGARYASDEKIYAPEARRVDLMFRFEEQQGLVTLD